MANRRSNRGGLRLCRIFRGSWWTRRLPILTTKWGVALFIMPLVIIAGMGIAVIGGLLMGLKGDGIIRDEAELIALSPVVHPSRRSACHISTIVC